MKKTTNWMRLVCLLMAVLMSVALFAGCKKDEVKNESSKPPTKADNSTPQTDLIEEAQDTWSPNIPEEKDLGGFDLSFAVYAGETDYIIPEEGETAEGDLIRESMLDLQKRYNITFSTVEIIDWNAEVLPNLLAGDQVAHVLLPTVHQTGAYISARLLADWKADAVSKYIKPERDWWWNETMQYATTVGGKTYAGCCNIVNYAESTTVMIFNKNILKEIGKSENDLYKMYNDKSWTWNAFREIAALAVKDLNNDGVMDEKDRWGLACPDYDTIVAFLTSAGADSIRSDDGITAKYTYTDTYSIKTITTLNEMFTLDNFFWTGSMKSRENEGKGDWAYVGHFVSGKALFTAGGVGFASRERVREADFDIGMMPLPKGPVNDKNDADGWQDKYKSRVDHNFKATLIPANNPDIEKTAFVLEAVAFTRWQLTNKYMEAFGIAYFNDDTSAEMVTEIYNWSTFEISQPFISVDNGSFSTLVFDPLFKGICYTPNFDVVGTFSSVADAAQVIIDEYFAGKR